MIAGFDPSEEPMGERPRTDAWDRRRWAIHQSAMARARLRELKFKAAFDPAQPARGGFPYFGGRNG